MKDHTLEDFFKLKTLTDVTLSPDAGKIAFISSNTKKEFKEQMVNRVVIRDLTNGSEEFVTEDGLTCSSLSFSPDGTRIAFVLTEKEKNYVEILNVHTLESERSYVRGKLSKVRWVSDFSIAVLMDDYHPEEAKRKKTGDDGYFFEEDHKFTSLWLFTPGTGFRRISSGLQVWDFSISGEKAAAITSSYPYNWSWYRAEISIIDMATGKSRVVYSPDRRQLSSPSFSHDGRTIYFIECLMSDNGVESGDIISLDAETYKWKNLTEDIDKSFSCFLPQPDGSIYALSQSMGTFEILDPVGGKVYWSSFGAVSPLFSPKFSFANGKFALAFTSKDQRQEVLLIEGGGKAKVESSQNSDISELRSYPSSLVRWKSEDGLEVHGILRKLSDKAPLVVVVHGGPTSSSVESFIDLSTVLMGQGFSVFLPNYRGSTGRGRKYAELNRGDMGGMDFVDIMTGIDHLIKTEKINGDKIYITGGSYGGFMSAWAITQTDRFRASVSLFGISDWISFHGVSSLADWDSVHYDQDPYKFDRFLKFSAIRYLDNVNTPVLLMHGIEDPYVPVGQYYQFYRGLKDKGKEARLLLFPREGHGFNEKNHVIMYIREMVKFFNEHP